MAELKQGRWVKVHEPGQANYVESENVMDIVIGADRCQAEATYTVRSYRKAAFWLNEYLRCAEALQTIAQDAIEQIQAASDAANREDPKVAVTGESWTCEIEKMADGEFKVCLNWAVSEPVVKKGKKPAAKDKDKEEAPKRGGAAGKRRKKLNEISS